jgi:hypothetical protein
MDAAAGVDGNLRDAAKVLGLAGDHDVHVLGAPYDAPGPHGQAADHHEFRACGNEAPQQLIERRLGQVCRSRQAAPSNRISL